MPRPPESAATAPSAGASLVQTIAIVLLWNTGFKGVRVACTLNGLELGAEPFDIGLLLAAFGVFPLLLAVHAGRIADRYGPRLPIIAGAALSALGVILPWADPTLPMLFAAAAVCGAGFILVQVPIQSFMGSLGAGTARTRNLNLYTLAVAASDVAGPVIAGFSIDYYGHARAFLHLFAFSAAAVVAVAVLAHRLPLAAAPGAGTGRRSMRELARTGGLRRIFVASALVAAGLDLFLLYLPIYGHSIGLTASAIGVIMGAYAAAGFVTRAVLVPVVRRVGEEPTLCYSMLLSAAAFVLIPAFEDAAVLGVVCFVLGLGMGAGQPLTVILTYNYAPPGRHGEGLGLRIAVNNTVHVGVPALFGAVGSVVGLAPVFWLSAAILAAGGYVGWPRTAAGIAEK